MSGTSVNLPVLPPLPGVERLAPIGLAELTALPDLQTRVDRKYVVPPAVASGLLREHETTSAVLEVDGLRSLRYESTYLDTDDLVCFRAAAHRRRRRFKARTRTYLDTGVCLLEVKTRGGRGETVKRRVPYPAEGRAWLSDDGRAVLAAWLADWVDGDLPDLVPTLTTAYRRTTLVDPATGARVTLDADVRAWTPDGRSAPVCRGVVVETKAATAAPTATDRWLWACGRRPVSVSKYCVGLAAVTPGLPTNQWHQVLADQL